MFQYIYKPALFLILILEESALSVKQGWQVQGILDFDTDNQ